MYKASAYIGGNAIFTDDDIEVKSPLDNRTVGTIPDLNEEQVLEAFTIAKEAFNKWSQVDHQTRVKYLLAFAAKLKEHANVISQIVHLEIGKNIRSSHEEVIRSADYIVETCHAYSDLVEKPEQYSYENNVLIPKNIHATYLRVPLGVVLSISPFNYPVNLMISKIAPAILVGNTVVHKSATNGSLSGWYISKLFHEVSVDGYLVTPGVLNYVTGRGSKVGGWLIKGDPIDAFAFTGSTETGFFISRSLPRIVPLQLELGGHNPAIIFESSDLDLAVKSIIKGAFTFSGQRCTSIKRVLVDRRISEKFIEKIKSAVGEVTLDEPLINLNSVVNFQEACKDALEKGATLISDSLVVKNNYVTPMVFSNVSKGMRIFGEEVFGPIIAITEYGKIEEAKELANDSVYGLQASIFSNSIEDATKFALDLEFSRININDLPARSPDILPFSGIKNSGFEVQGIKNSIYFFTRFKGIVLKKELEEVKSY